MTQEQLYQQQQAQKALGDRGEDFALRYERQRLHAHPKCMDVRLIGRTDVGTGYDILSYQSINSQHPDRYIEVKTYSHNVHFFLSPSEQAAARKYGTSYYLYLVDATQLNSPGYEPLIIQDPIHTLSGSEWQETAQSREFVYSDDAVHPIPDDLDACTVLLGCYTTNDHLNWILRTHSYNVRQGVINGSVCSDEMTTTPAYLVLYHVRDPRTYRIHKIIGTRTATKAQMMSWRYPNPHAASYMLYNLDLNMIPIPLDIMALVRLHNDKLQRTSGTPIYIAGATLRRYILGGPSKPGSKITRLYTNEGKPWTQVQSAQLSALYLTGTTIPALAHTLKRTVQEIKTQLHTLGLLLP